MTLSVGNVTETVTVTGESPVAEPGKIDLGRTIGETEVKNLPLVSRNPYNFAFLQANVTGYENNEFGVPRINANGSADAHQLPDRRQHQHREGSRRPAAAADVRSAGARSEGRHQRLRAGVRPDDGHGLQRDHAVGHQRPARIGELPLQAQRVLDASRSSSPTARASPTPRRTTSRPRWAARSSKDKWHYYGAYEYVDRSLVTGGQVITVTPANAAALGITLPSDGVIPAHQKVNFVFGKTDYQFSPANQLSVRYFLFKNFSPSNIGGGLTTTDRATDFTDRMDSASAQLVSTIGSNMLNELRVQYARRHQFRTQGISVTVRRSPCSGAANFGGAQHRRRQLGRLRLQPGDHAGDRQRQLDSRPARASRAASTRSSSPTTRVRGDLFLYTFPTIDAYLAAKSGANPFAYTTLQQLFGNTAVELQLGVLRLVRPGRLAADAAAQGAVRPALRPVRRPVGAPVRGQPVLARTSRSTRTTSGRAPACRGRSIRQRAPSSARRPA